MFEFTSMHLELIWKKLQTQQEVLKLNDISVSWSSPKTDLETDFLNSEIRSFENVLFSG